MNKEKINKIILFEVIALNIIGLAYCIYSCVRYGEIYARNAINIINYFCILYYVLVGYKKPHGNLLKYLMVVYAIGIAFVGVAFARESIIFADCVVAAAMTVMFIAGRLNKVKKNSYLAILVMAFLVLGLCFIPESYDHNTGFVRILKNFGVFVQWISIVSAYSRRYREHQTAGLVDKGESS